MKNTKKGGKSGIVSSEWVKKHTNYISKAYFTALKMGYDITSPEEVLNLLKTTDPKRADLEYAKTFSGMLQICDRMLKKELEQKEKMN